MVSGCRIEISYVDPESYTSIVNHDLRKAILSSLYAMALDGPVSKQDLADRVGIEYHQLVYQLSHQLSDFWKVAEERKVRGTRQELIVPASPSSIFITIGRDGKIFVIDPLADLFGPLANVGTRCDGCSKKDYERCLKHVQSGCCFESTPRPEEAATLESNGRKAPWRPVDLAILCSLKGIATGKTCSVSIPCDSCPFMRRVIKFDDAAR
ncbi:hypothetical protein [Methanomassiliicoccus luminyensis]|jgi:hypothetical protein|uniref:hypothetical protein n=1 Tax=Methanomassiliicoccus luminyensis TaxID=1080712 RepID=UPI00037F69C3|nr:hypothetical protein [Methanomassiliicoccus luminyensis]